MRSITILYLFTFLTIGNLFAIPKEDKKKVETTVDAFTGGIVYALPRTGVRIYVEASQEKFFRGPYYEFAQKYLGIKNALPTDGENWIITGVKMETFGEPDPAEIHKAKGAVASMLSLSENGILLGVNSDEKAEKNKISDSDFISNIDFPRQIWQDLSMHSFRAEKDTSHHSGEKFKSFEEKAAEAAADILKLRKRKALALAANYDKLPPDGKAYQVMVEELDKIIDEYMALFIGKSFREKHSYTFEVVPDNKSTKGVVAFRFSPSSGILPENNVSGKPIMLDLDPNVDLTKNSSQSAASEEVSASSVYYRIPGMANVRILNGNDVLAQARLSLAQFGVVATLPDGLLNGEYKITFHQATGAIRRIGN